MSNNDEFFKLLDRHKKNITCDLCNNTIWFFQKAIRCVVRIKENIWTEYYHVKCLKKVGAIRKLDKSKKDKRGKNDDSSTSNLVH